MNKYLKSIIIALISFVIIIILNFILPRLISGDPVMYLTGFSEEEMTLEQYNYYYHALGLDQNIFKQFLDYLGSLFNGTLGYSYQYNENVNVLINERIGNTLQISLPALIISTGLGLVWGLNAAYKKDGVGDKISTALLIVVNTVPTFLIALILVTYLAFKAKLFPYLGLNSYGVDSGFGYFIDRIWHLVLPVLTLVIATLPSRFLIVKNTAQVAMDNKYILYAKTRGLSPMKIKYKYLFTNIAQPFISMVGMSVGILLGGSLVIENVFSINGMGKLLMDSTYKLDYPTIQGCLFVTTFIMVLSIIATNIICIIIDPKERGKHYED